MGQRKSRLYFNEWREIKIKIKKQFSTYHACTSYFPLVSLVKEAADKDKKRNTGGAMGNRKNCQRGMWDNPSPGEYAPRHAVESALGLGLVSCIL
jgi:hypothetical protein